VALGWSTCPAFPDESVVHTLYTEAIADCMTPSYMRSTVGISDMRISCQGCGDRQCIQLSNKQEEVMYRGNVIIDLVGKSSEANATFLGLQRP
jgi:hypothetical protein